MGSIETCLDEILPLWLCDEGLELCGSEGVYKTCLRYNEEQDLCASESRKLICLLIMDKIPS